MYDDGDSFEISVDGEDGVYDGDNGIDCLDCKDYVPSSVGVVVVVL